MMISPRRLRNGSQFAQGTSAWGSHLMKVDGSQWVELDGKDDQCLRLMSSFELKGYYHPMALKCVLPIEMIQAMQYLSLERGRIKHIVLSYSKCCVVQPHYEKVVRHFNGPDAPHPGIILMARVDCALKLYKSALGNVFEVDKWGPIEYCIMAKHFERHGKSPYAYHAVS
ncbi:hypothetical protein Droror1_Dr00017779 [Drosera rotundifolia]